MTAERGNYRGPLLFSVAVVLHALLILEVFTPAPTSSHQDVNIYLEQAMNVWQEGLFTGRVTFRQYPYGYPLLVAPAFALASNVARFTAIYVLHAVLFGLASLTLRPLLSSALGHRSSWVVLSAAQFLAGSTVAAGHAQSEGLFTPLVIATTGLAYQAWSKPSARRFLLLGAAAGLCAATRRLGLVVPVALVLVLAWDLWTSENRARALRLAGWSALGLVAGFLPDIVAYWERGAGLRSYPGTVEGYSAAVSKTVLSLENALIAVRTVARQLTYFGVISFGAPALLAALLHRGWRHPNPPPLALRRTAVLVGLMSLGMAALTSMHILRQTYNTTLARSYSVYPRYLDPMELPLIAVAIVGGAWLISVFKDRHSRLAALLPYFGALCLLGGLAGPWHRGRFGRLPSAAALENWGVGFLGPPFLLLCLLVIVTLACVHWTRNRHSTVQTVWIAVGLSWLLSLHFPISWVTNPRSPRPPPEIQMVPPVVDEPSAPACILVPPNRGRILYALAFRSDRPVQFVHKRELDHCMQRNPEGWVLTSKVGGWQPPNGAAPEAEDRHFVGWRVRTVISPTPPPETPARTPPDGAEAKGPNP